MIIIFENFTLDHPLLDEYYKAFGKKHVFSSYSTFIDFITCLDKNDTFLINSWDTSYNTLTMDEKITLNAIYGRHGALTIYNRTTTTQELDSQMMARKLYMEVVAYIDK